MAEMQGMNRSMPMSVSQLTQQIKTCLEHRFRGIWLIGQVSNFTRARSGHWYFSLKDEAAQIRVNMWRSMTTRVSVELRDGMEVLVFGTLNVYPPRGEYALIAERLEDRGLGRLKREFDLLKAKLKEEGLFDPQLKKPLPLLPRKIGVVTSATGAAIRDILRVIENRFPGMHLLLYPVSVQGAGAAGEIAQGIEYLDRFGGCDVLIVGRGGGSEEDLWAFNEEAVARAIFRAQTPVVSAVGHETDVTISDFVADVRAATPSNAAELVVRSRSEYRNMVDLRRKALDQRMHAALFSAASRLQRMESHPALLRVPSRINDAQRKLAELDHGLYRRVMEVFRQRHIALLELQKDVSRDALRWRLSKLADRLSRASDALSQKTQRVMTAAQETTAHLMGRLEDLAPTRILARGYSVVFNRKRQVIKSPEHVRFGEILEVLTHAGAFHVRVVDTSHERPQAGLFHQTEETP